MCTCFWNEVTGAKRIRMRVRNWHSERPHYDKNGNEHGWGTAVYTVEVLSKNKTACIVKNVSIKLDRCDLTFLFPQLNLWESLCWLCGVFMLPLMDLQTAACSRYYRSAHNTEHAVCVYDVVLFFF